MSEGPVSAVAFKDVSKSFGKHRVLDGISLDVARGECVAIMGSSGGGKTTLLRCVAGLLRPTSGVVLVDGVDSASQPEAARKALGMVFQSSALFDSMTVGENIAFGLKRHTNLRAREREAKVLEALEMVGLASAESLMPNELSGGMRKRVGIARAIALRPLVMLYDEPTTGLDPITTYTIDQLIATLRKDLGMTSLIVSHDVTSVFRVADRVAFLHEGRLVYTGTPGGLIDAQEPSIRELLEKSQARSLAAS